MTRSRFAAVLTTMMLLAIVAGCSDDSSSPSASATPAAGTFQSSDGATAEVTESSEPSTGSPEGEWSVELTREAVLANLRRHGFGDVVEKVVTPTPMGHYDLRISGDQLLLFDPHGDVMDDGTITVKGDRMSIEANEVPGVSVLRFEITGTTMRLSFVRQNRPEMAPGLTEEPIIRMLYTTAPWTSSS